MTKQMKPRTLARAIARNIPISDGDVVLLKRHDEFSETLKVFNALRNSLAATRRVNCVVVVVDEFDDLIALTEEQMRDYGWCKCRGDSDE